MAKKKRVKAIKGKPKYNYQLLLPGGRYWLRQNVDGTFQKIYAINSGVRKRELIFQRYDYRCAYCQTEVVHYSPGVPPGLPPPANLATLDHVVPRPRNSMAWNLVCACVNCNQKKSDSTLATFAMKYPD